MKKGLPIGVSEFEKIRVRDYYYVDKTLLIADWLNSAAEVTLITRPRRFGKTLNMTMLREFFDITKDNKALFAGLDIEKTAYLTELNEWPVIFLSFKDCKGKKENALLCVYRQLFRVYDQYAFVSETASEMKQKRWAMMCEQLIEQNIDKLYFLSDAIFFLSQMLCEYYHKKVILLIDEYDTPMIAAHGQGYYEEVHDFFSSLYSTALKDNPYLERALLTGIHRIAKENIFSGLNNLEVCTVKQAAYSQYFGLTPDETEALLGYYGLQLNEQVQAMYDGYRFGKQEIYNPWSILNYAKNNILEPYWVNTASNEMLVQAMLAADQDMKHDLELLLSEGHVKVSVDLQTSFFELNQAATLWGLFLNSGYLTAMQTADVETSQMEVCIPNQEVRTSFRRIMELYGGFQANSLDGLFGALQRKDMEAFQRTYEQIILTCTSFHDGSPENAYHMLFLGMCVYLDADYRVSSNIEHGHGRADILLEAKRKEKPNFVIEFKQGKDIEQLAKEAMAQIHQKKYFAGLQGETILLAIAHDLKQCCIIKECITI